MESPRENNDPFDDAAAFLEASLVHPAIPTLSPDKGTLYTSQNVVSNLMLDPEKRDENGNFVPCAIELMKLLKASYTTAEHKQSFGAGIFRFIQPLKEEQMAVSELKPDSVTHLGFATGALGSTGNTSTEQAIYFCQLYRLDLHAKLGLYTSFRRFNIPNTVCTTSLGYPIDLARMHSAAPTKRPYFPDIFPGLFFYYEHVHEDRTAIYNKVRGTSHRAKRRLCLVEGDLEQFQNSLHHGPVSSEARAAAIDAASNRNLDSLDADDPILRDVALAFNTYLPLEEKAVVLVFTGGNMVGLGIKNAQLGQDAFRCVTEIAKEFRLSPEKEKEFYEQQKQGSGSGGKKRKSQARLKEKNKVLNEGAYNYRNPISKDGLKELERINLTVADEKERNDKIRQLMIEEAKRKGKGKKRKSATGLDDDGFDDEELQEIAAEVTSSVVGNGELQDTAVDEEIDAALKEVDAEGDCDVGGDTTLHTTGLHHHQQPPPVENVADFLFSHLLTGVSLK